MFARLPTDVALKDVIATGFKELAFAQVSAGCSVPAYTISIFCLFFSLLK